MSSPVPPAKPEVDPRAPAQAAPPDPALYLNAIIDSSDDAIISKNLQGVIQTWNKSAERIFGYTAAEAIGQPIALLIPENRLDEEPEILGRIRRGDRVDHYETVRRRKDGSLVNISLMVSPIRDHTGTIIGASKIARDITEQKRFADLNRYFEAIVESSDDAILSKNLNGIVQSWNKGAERIFGYKAHEMIGQSVLKLIPEGRKNEEPEILGRLQRGERIDHYETFRQRKDGSLVAISLTVSPIKDVSGKIVGASKIARDISDRKKAEEALRNARAELEKLNETLEQRVKDRTASLREAVSQMQEFSYTISHDLRGPVRAMQGYASAVIEDFSAQLDPQAKEYLQRIVRGAVRMDKLIHDVLIYSRLAQSEMVRKPISLDALLKDILQHYPEMQSPHATVTVQEPLLDVLGHESSLTLAISNLLSNAKKFVAPGQTPQIEIWTERLGGNVRLWIKDHGIGIKPEYRSRLFGMFERGNQDARYEGTGIGLAITRKAMEKMGGQVGLESDSGAGSAFWIELPAAP